jgi:hypothetical protein
MLVPLVLSLIGITVFGGVTWLLYRTFTRTDTPLSAFFIGAIMVIFGLLTLLSGICGALLMR